MKVDYKNYPQEYIGDSDGAYLIVDSDKGLFKLKFGKDAGYHAYMVDQDAEIGSHYEEVFSCGNWISVYDDFGLTIRAQGEGIKIYRAGEMGCIIQIFNGRYILN